MTASLFSARNDVYDRLLFAHDSYTIRDSKNRTVSRTVPQNSKVFSDWQIIQTPSYSLRCVRAGRYDFGTHFSFVSEWQQTYRYFPNNPQNDLRIQCTIPKKKGLTVPGPSVKGVPSIGGPWPVFSLELLYPWWYTHFRMLKSNFLSVNEDWLAFAAGASRLRIVAKSRSHRRLTCGRRPAVILCRRVACTTKGRP